MDIPQAKPILLMTTTLSSAAEAADGLSIGLRDSLAPKKFGTTPKLQAEDWPPRACSFSVLGACCKTVSCVNSCWWDLTSNCTAAKPCPCTSQ
jgi:hypothetical protein